MNRIIILILPAVMMSLAGCGNTGSPGEQVVSFRDQEGHTVGVPRHLERISGEGGIIYALGQQDKLVDRGMYYGPEGDAMARVDSRLAAKPNLREGKRHMNYETLTALRPQIYFANSEFHKEDKEQMERAGLSVFAIRCETIDESFEAVRKMGRVLACEDKAHAYLDDCRRLLKIAEDRTRDIPAEKRFKVMFAGPKSVYTVATGEMLQTEIIRRAGGENVAAGLKGFWADISPEQVAEWDPDVIFLGSSWGTFGVEEVYRNSQFQTVTAVKERRVFAFPSNVGWWDFPPPHCVLGVVWAAKTMYPERFTGVDMLKIADDFYAKYRGYTFTALGGRL